MFQQGTQSLLPSAQKGEDAVVSMQTLLASLCLPTLTGRVVLMVRDELWDGVEQVLFCQVILILGGAAYNVMADHALGVSGETVHGISGMGRQAEGEGCLEAPSELGPSCS